MALSVIATPSKLPDTVLPDEVFHVATAVSPAASASDCWGGEDNTENADTNRTRAATKRFMRAR